jgi:hypothetical protein
MNFGLRIGKAIVIGLSLASVLVGSVASAQYIRPLAKVANDRHNLAQIARNCRYQQLN